MPAQWQACLFNQLGAAAAAYGQGPPKHATAVPCVGVVLRHTQRARSAAAASSSLQ
jgi:hypothetical protein